MRRRNRKEYSAIFSRRALIVGTAQGSLLALLATRMYYLQVLQSEKYQLLSDDNRINVIYEPPIRGVIYDCKKKLLADNRQVHNLIFQPEYTEDHAHIFACLQKIISFTPDEIESAKRALRRNKSRAPVLLREDLTWSNVNLVETNAPDLPGITIKNTQIRRYPMAASMAHIIGYVGRAFPEDVQEQHDPVLLLPGFRIGRSGIEKSLETALRGNAGKKLVETNALGKTIRILQKIPSEHGLSIDLTVDSQLQEEGHRILSQQGSAAAVVINVETGAIQALVSTPSYDPNKFITGFTREEWETLRANKLSPFRNKSLAGTYAPGSTFKMIVALAALKEGLDPREYIRCNGRLRVGKQIFHCWKRRGHGPINLHDSLVQSCDLYYYELAQRLGIAKIATMARLFGLGRKQMLAMVDERPGNVPDEKWKLLKRKSEWRTGDTLNTSIGQGFILATPLQLASMTASLVNGGYSIQPHLFKQDVPFSRVNLGIPPEYLRIIVHAMEAVTAHEIGTAYEARILEPGFEMGGKTGTTQVRSISTAEREDGIIKNEELPRQFRDHALFVGFAPVHKPKFACSVVIEHGGSGGRIAAPVARDLLLKTQRIDAIDNDLIKSMPNLPGGTQTDFAI